MAQQTDDETTMRREEQSMRKWFAEVAKAAAAFERRWTWPALARVNGELALRLRDQRNRFDAAMVTGTTREIEGHGAAMCRGYRAAVEALEKAEAPDDAYAIGTDRATGVSVAIGTQRAAADRVAELHGAGVIFMTPDEVARVMAASADAAHFIGEVKRIWPGAVMQ